MFVIPNEDPLDLTGRIISSEHIILVNTYLKVQWKHQLDDEPVLLYSELDPERCEKRKVEIFKDGTMSSASRGLRHGNTRLGEESIPSIVEIAADPQFELAEITAEEFEAVWRKAAE